MHGEPKAAKMIARAAQQLLIVMFVLIFDCYHPEEVAWYLVEELDAEESQSWTSEEKLLMVGQLLLLRQWLFQELVLDLADSNLKRYL